jgi:hypothetical protein
LGRELEGVKKKTLGWTIAKIKNLCLIVTCRDFEDRDHRSGRESVIP